MNSDSIWLDDIDLPLIPRPRPRPNDNSKLKRAPIATFVAAKRIMARGSKVYAAEPVPESSQRRSKLREKLLEIEKCMPPMPRSSSTIVSTMPGELSVSYKPEKPLTARDDVEIMTADVFGDPPPGRSMLDQKMGRT